MTDNNINSILFDLQKNLEDLSSAKEQMDEFRTVSLKVVEGIDTVREKLIEFISDLKEVDKKRSAKFEAKINYLQLKIDSLKEQVDRLEKIDLEKHFDKLQKTLSEIFGAVNAINLILTAITQTLNSIVQSLGTIQRLINSGFEETNSNINQGFITTNKNINEAGEKTISDLVSHINFKSKEIDVHLESQDEKIKFLAEQNHILKKGIKTNRIIQIIGVVLILIILIYVAVKV